LQIRLQIAQRFRGFGPSVTSGVSLVSLYVAVGVPPGAQFAKSEAPCYTDTSPHSVSKMSTRSFRSIYPMAHVAGFQGDFLGHDLRTAFYFFYYYSILYPTTRHDRVVKGIQETYNSRRVIFNKLLH